MLKFLVMDVDGTLTDGKIYMGDEGERFKVFDIKDGYAIKEMLPQYGIIPIVITARSSDILINRCSELDIEGIYQGVRNKIENLNEIMEQQGFKDDKKYSYRDCAYIGDDILDLQCMEPIKERGGFVGCPADAAKEVKEIADYVCVKNGGDGAVREFIEWLIKMM